MTTSDAKAETHDSSGTKGPEDTEHVEPQPRSHDDTLKPGGSHGAAAGVGMSEVDPDALPGRALDPGQEWFGGTRDGAAEDRTE
jgi:hypothetical protein